MSAAIVANCSRVGRYIIHQLLQGLSFTIGAGQRLIEVINISLVVLAVMYLHGLRIYVRLQSIVRIW